jgi:hypothetical protein
MVARGDNCRAIEKGVGEERVGEEPGCGPDLNKCKSHSGRGGGGTGGP